MTAYTLTTTKATFLVTCSFLLVPALFAFLLTEVFRPWIIHVFLYGSVNAGITATVLVSILPLLFTLWYVLKHHRTQEPIQKAATKAAFSEHRVSQ